jgi:hypothetical protein
MKRWNSISSYQFMKMPSKQRITRANDPSLNKIWIELSQDQNLGTSFTPGIPYPSGTLNQVVSTLEFK